MPRNVEIKARLVDFAHADALARELSGSDAQTIVQEDVFFPCQNGRLKLRIFSPERGELIHYHRPDQPGPKTSRYLITPTPDPLGLRETLSHAYGEQAVVRKTRLLYLVGRTRIHLDRVESLGDFLELEVVLAEAEAVESAQTEAHHLMSRFGIASQELISGAYVDLLLTSDL